MKTETQTQHTQIECTLEDCSNGGAIVCFGNPKQLNSQRIQFPKIETAKRIVKAVNMHDKLIEALENVLHDYWAQVDEDPNAGINDLNKSLQRARTLLKQAEQK